MRRFLSLLLSLLFRSFHNRIGFVGARLITVMLNRCSRLSSTTRAREGERNSLKFRIIYFNDWVQTNPPDSQIVILQWHCNVRYTYLGFMVVGALIRMSACQTCSRARTSVHQWNEEMKYWPWQKWQCHHEMFDDLFLSSDVTTTQARTSIKSTVNDSLFFLSDFVFLTLLWLLWLLFCNRFQWNTVWVKWHRIRFCTGFRWHKLSFIWSAVVWFGLFLSTLTASVLSFCAFGWSIW